MFILINGSFGIGKTTVASLLNRELPGSTIYDPERVGYVLRRLPPWMLGLRRQPDDYQDLRLWRALVARGAVAAHRRGVPVIVPMAFTNRDYFEGFASALGAAAPVRRLCLVAPLEVIRARLSERAARESGVVSEWQLRRSAECVEAHRDPVFGMPIAAVGTPAEIVVRIRQAAGV